MLPLRDLAPWYQHGVRLVVACAVAVLCLAGCGASAEPPEPAAADTAAGPVEPPRINRARGHLPLGYETADIPKPAIPVSFWGLGPDWAADPPQCAALADPVDDHAGAHGWSASGAGGIVYAVAAPAAAAPDPALLEDCGQWTVSAGNSTGTVAAVAAPDIADAVTVGMVTAASTVVEGGTETTIHADTYSAYLDGHVVVITVVTDPGLPGQPLGPDFAATLLNETISELRGGRHRAG